MIVFVLLLTLTATYYPLDYGWLAPIALAIFFMSHPSRDQVVFYSAALLMSHLWWVAYTAYVHMQTPLSGALLLFAILFAWFVMMSTIFWYAGYTITVGWPSSVRQLMLLPAFFCVVSHAIPFLSGTSGYPFINPLLPAVAWWQARLKKQPPHINNHPLVYLPPQKDRGRVACAQQLLLALNRLAPSKGAIIVSPESTFRYALLPESEELLWWRSVLPERAEWLFGGVWEKNKNRSQAALILTKEPIINNYIKHNCIDFFEYAPQDARWASWLNRLIGWKTGNLQPARTGGASLLLAGQPVQVMLCSEALSAPFTEQQVVVLANESWLLPWVQELFIAQIAWRAWWTGCTVTMVTHQHGVRTL